MAHESFINHAGYRYLRWSLILITAALVAYIWHDPHPRPSGGTWLGYTLGGISAFIVLLLLYLGIRKRRYRSAMGTLKGWVSAHVWLGLSLLVLTTLHSGAQLGWNIHSVAYLLLIAVVLSGLWGTVIYRRNPALMTSNRNQQNRLVLLQQLFDLDAEALQQADRIGTGLHHEMAQAMQPNETTGFMSRITNRYWSDTIRADRDADHRNNVYAIEQTIAAHIAASTDAEQVRQLRDILGTVSKRRQVSRQLGKDLHLQAHMELWLMLHVPLSIALLAALISHVTAVFFYW